MEEEFLKQAVEYTYKKYGIDQAIGAIKKIFEEGDFTYFTNDHKVREQLQKLGLNNTKNIIERQYIKRVLNEKKQDLSPLEEAIKATYDKYCIKKGNLRAEEIVEKCLKDCMEKNKNHFTETHKKRQKLNDAANWKRMSIQKYVINEVACSLAVDIVLEIKEANRNRMSNVQVHKRNLERCQEAVLSGMELQQVGSISIGKSLQATSSIGKFRKNQEDAVLLIKNSQNPGFKMLVVADGMGGGIVGEEASDKVVKSLKSWFESLDKSYYENPENLVELLNQELQNISSEIYEARGGASGSTFVGAIVCKDKTLISNVGDSRAYILKNGKMKQVTEDHTPVNDYYKSGKISKEDMRFHIAAHIINQGLGVQEAVSPDFYIIRNQEYDSILCLSDGVTDCLSDKDILAISRKTDRQNLAKMLVKEALNHDSYREKKDDEVSFDKVIYGGKDNTTAAVYNKLDDEDREER